MIVLAWGEDGQGGGELPVDYGHWASYHMSRHHNISSSLSQVQYSFTCIKNEKLILKALDLLATNMWYSMAKQYLEDLVDMAKCKIV